MENDGMSKRIIPTVHDVAQLAGVSTATVDRVLNQRSGVRAATAQRVVQAAGQLRYLPLDELHRVLRPRPLELVFLLPSGTNPYLRMLADQVRVSEAEFIAYNVRCRQVFFEGFNPQALARALLTQARRADAVAFMALNHPLVKDAVGRLSSQGRFVMTLISDLDQSPRLAYVGMDNRAAGRTAGLLLGRFIGARRGELALIAGSRSYLAHEEREAGFLSVMRESFPALRIVGLREGQDDADNNYRQARSLIRQYPGLAGIYNIGGASEGVARALLETGRAREIVFVGHGLTPDTRQQLIDGTLDVVITQHPSAMIGNCVRIASNLRDGRPALEGVEPIRMGVFLRENLP
jgi:LacI family transcriptional regulator